MEKRICWGKEHSIAYLTSTAAAGAVARPAWAALHRTYGDTEQGYFVRDEDEHGCDIKHQETVIGNRTRKRGETTNGTQNGRAVYAWPNR